MKIKLTQDYILFTKKERRGIAIVLLLTFFLFLIPAAFPYFLTPKTNIADNNSLTAIAALTQAAAADSNAYANKYKFQEMESPRFKDMDPKNAVYNTSIKGELFYFDPNTCTNAQWKTLGLYDNTINTVNNFKAKGGKFFEADDIALIYGLSDEMIERLMPFVRIDKTNLYNKAPYKNTNENPSLANNTGKPYNQPSQNYQVDINTADTTAWKNLPGIGSKLSYRIFNYKNKLGGFYSIDQVAETFGLPDSTFQKIRTKLVVNPQNITTININAASFEQLTTHPYINKSLANNIIQYRTQHGKFIDENSMRKLALFNETTWQKLKPYITF
jgi:competence protein ComEA